MPLACTGAVECTRIDLTHVKPGYEYPAGKTEFEHNYRRSGPYRDEDLKMAVYMDDMIADPARLYAMTSMTPEMFDLTAHKVRVWKTTTKRGFLMWEDAHRESDGGNRGKLNAKRAFLVALSHKLVCCNQSRTAAFSMKQSTVHRYLKMMDEALEAVLPTTSSFEEQINAICDEWKERTKAPADAEPDTGPQDTENVPPDPYLVNVPP